MFEVHIVNSNILTIKISFLFLRNGPRKAHSLVPSPSQCVKAQSWTPGIFSSRWRAHWEERICFRCHNLGMMVRKSGTFLDMNKCINRPLKLKRFRDQKWNNFAYILNGVMLKLVSKELCSVCKQVRKKILIYIYWNLRLSHIHVNFLYQMEL